MTYLLRNSSDLSETMTAVADVLQDGVSKGQLLDLSSPTVLAKLLPSVSATVLSSVVTANELTDYAEVLDKQILLLADNADGTLKSAGGDGFQYIAIKIGANFNSSDVFKAQISNTLGGLTISSTDLVSFGQNVAIFKFSNEEVASLGAGTFNLAVENSTTQEHIFHK